MSPRSLQRKLAAEGAAFRKLVDTVRQELAESYPGDDGFTLEEISYLLGFSSQAAFTRAFKRWTSSTPREFRDAA
jgi:AraC-like DNA-binding protein